MNLLILNSDIASLGERTEKLLESKTDDIIS